MQTELLSWQNKWYKQAGLQDAKIWAENNSNGGARFIVLLPIKQ